MKELTTAITTELAKLPEGTPVTAAKFLHLADRESVSRTLCALAKDGEVFRVSRGVYVDTMMSGFGRHKTPSTPLHRTARPTIRRGHRTLWGDLRQQTRLDTQVPMHVVYWTTGRTCSYKMRKLVIYLEHVPAWQLVLWNEPAGELIRALAWAGSAEVSKVLRQLTERVPVDAIGVLQKNASALPAWIQDALQQVG